MIQHPGNREYDVKTAIPVSGIHEIILLKV
jgi:hypothetical protein